MRRLIPLLIVLAIACCAPLASARILDGGIALPSDITAEATGPSGAVVTYSVDSDVTCDPASGSTFALGTTAVNCTNTGGESGSFNVTVQDTTPPDFGSLADVTDSTADSNKVVTYSTPSAADAVDGSVTGSCNPTSGSTFPLGTTTVNCSATDAHGNTGTGSFTVTVNDVGAPTFSSSPDNIGPVEATGPGGAAVSFTTPTANDNSGSATVSCDPASGSTFPLGTTGDTCTATDASGNTATASFSVTVHDTTKPVFGSAPDVNETTSSLSGKNVSYTPPSATDAVSGTIAGSCSPAPGSHFDVGSTEVTCTASDGAGNAADPVKFHVNVTFVDTTGPTVNVPGDIVREANGPTGSVVTYTTPTATDDVDGPIASVNCSPASGITYPLGTTTVTCTASDSHGNPGSASFNITVRDTTPPSLIAPGDKSVYATSERGIEPGDGPAATFLAGAFAADIVDPHPTITTDAPGVFFVGSTVVTFTARDASGNATSATATLTVLPMPPEGTTPAPLPPPVDRQPPDDVGNLAAAAGDGLVRLSWKKPSAPDFDEVQITRSVSGEAGGQVVYHGSATSFVDHGVQNGVEYRYVVVAVDKNGNASAGVAVVARPMRAMLRTPKDGAVVKKPPKFVWLSVADATYYNFQLFRGDTKILSAWPAKPSLLLHKSWKYNGRTYKLTPGTYRWYVWPGFGPRADANYGDLLGQSSFTVRR